MRRNCRNREPNLHTNLYIFFLVGGGAGNGLIVGTLFQLRFGGLFFEGQGEGRYQKFTMYNS